MASHHKEFDEKHKLMMLKSFVEMKNQLADKEQRLQTMEKSLEESKVSQQQTYLNLHETTTKLNETVAKLDETTENLNKTMRKLNETEEKLRFWEHVQDEMKKQIKVATKNFASTTEILSTAFIEEGRLRDQQHQSFKNNLLILKDGNIESDLKRAVIEEKVKICGEDLSFHKEMQMREICLQKFCYNSRFKRFCNLMEFGRFYSTGDCYRYIKIEIKEDCVRNKLSIKVNYSMVDNFKIEVTEETTIIYLPFLRPHLMDPVADTEFQCNAVTDFPFPNNDGYLVFFNKSYRLKKMTRKKKSRIN